MPAMLHPAYAVTSLQALLLMAAATGVKESGPAVLKTPPIVKEEGPGRSCSHACMKPAHSCVTCRCKAANRAPLLTSLCMRHAQRSRS